MILRCSFRLDFPSLLLDFVVQEEIWNTAFPCHQSWVEYNMVGWHRSCLAETIILSLYFWFEQYDDLTSLPSSGLHPLVTERWNPDVGIPHVVRKIWKWHFPYLQLPDLTCARIIYGTNLPYTKLYNYLPPICLLEKWTNTLIGFW